MESSSIFVGNARLIVDRQSLHSLVTDSLWTVEFDADGKVLKRHEHEDDVDRRDWKRVRFTHKQRHKRADLECTDDMSHPVLSATRLRRICTIHLVESR